MDKLSIAGLVIAFLAIYLGFSIDGGNLSALLELPAFIIVFGGTLGAVMLQSSLAQFSHALSLLRWVFYPPNYNIEEGISDIVNWSGVARSSGYLALEDIALDTEDNFTQKGLTSLVDGIEAGEFIDKQKAAKIFKKYFDEDVERVKK